MLADLDDPSSLDPARVGAKAAWLARGRRAGLPVPGGFVVEASASTGHMRLGAEALARRGSGGARLEVAAAPVDGAAELIAAGAGLADRLVARSSTPSEGDGRWSGAFTSYLEVTPAELPRAVTGCWASAFTVAALERLEVAGVDPGAIPMAVLVQPFVDAEAGGWAGIAADGTVTVHGVKGSPAPLLQGWVSGHSARWAGGWSGDLLDLVGVDVADRLAAALRTATTRLGASRLEWALEGEPVILQLGTAPTVFVEPARPRLDGADSELLGRVLHAVLSAPGPLGEDLVLPWGLGGLPVPDPGDASGAADLVDARRRCVDLTAEVWQLPPDRALAAARETMTRLRGPDPAPALAQVARLRPVDPHQAAALLGIVAALRHRLVDLGVVPDPVTAWQLGADGMASALAGGHPVVGARLGVGRWEPLVAAIVLATGSTRSGTAAAPGVGAGIRLDATGAEDSAPGRRRVVVSARPVPNLAPLLWDAAGVVTATGSPAAHLFESARSLGVPAVCGVDIGADGDDVVAVDGHHGVVATLLSKGAR